MKKVQGLHLIVFLTLALFGLGSFAIEPMTYVYHGPESEKDIRYQYHWEVLRTALDKTLDSHGPYKMIATEYMNEDRQVAELKRGFGALTVMIRETSFDYEKILRPIRIPIDKDLIGYRVFLIDKQNQERFSQIETLEQLTKMTIGQGKGWGDIDILKASGFTVETGSNYEGLFLMLMKDRFDAFSRGVAEVIDEYKQRKNSLPNLHIEETITLYYPLPTYFWFTKDNQGAALAERVEAGLNKMIDDGSFDALFEKHHAHVINYHKLNDRKLFKIPNPFLPQETPFNDKRLWYKPKFKDE